MKRGFVSNEQRAARALAHGKITDLTSGFKLKGKSAFTLVIIPKANVASRFSFPGL